MSLPHEGASSSRINLVALAQSLAEDSACVCTFPCDEDEGTAFCPCAGDDCWNCAAQMALANDAESSRTTTPGTGTKGGGA